MDRRSFMKSVGTATVAAAALSSESSARNATTAETTTLRNSDTNTPPNPIRASITSTTAKWVPAPGDWNTTTINHLYRRAGFGATVAEMTAAKALAFDAVVDSLMDDGLLSGANLPALPYHAEDWYQVAPYIGSDYNKLIDQQQKYSIDNLEIRRDWGVQMMKRGTMLREKMALFWMNHFVVESTKVYYPQSMYSYLDYFRRNAWGNFKQMVKDVTISPAMLIYLDGILNQGLSPNENYARELQELFTMGVQDKNGNPNYTQDDVEAIAHSLTGWTIDRTASAPNVLPAKYNTALHDSRFQKIYDGVKRQYNLEASGASMDKDLIEHIFEQRGDQIAWFICSKLYQYFVYHEITTDAEKAVVQDLADTFKANWSVKEVLAKLLKSEHFFDSANIGAAIKSPYEHILGMIRHFDLPLDRLQSGTIYYYTAAQSQVLLDPPNVKGWPGYHTWISTTNLPARNFMATLLLVLGSLPAVGADGYGNSHTAITLTPDQVFAWAKQFASFDIGFDEVLAELSTFLCAQPLGPQALLYVKQQLPPNTYEWNTLTDQAKKGALVQMVKNILSLAEYQLA